jgi:hypothetical protein
VVHQWMKPSLADPGCCPQRRRLSARPDHRQRVRGRRGLARRASGDDAEQRGGRHNTIRLPERCRSTNGSCAAGDTPRRATTHTRSRAPAFRCPASSTTS